MCNAWYVFRVFMQCYTEILAQQRLTMGVFFPGLPMPLVQCRQIFTVILRIVPVRLTRCSSNAEDISFRYIIHNSQNLENRGDGKYECFWLELTVPDGDSTQKC